MKPDSTDERNRIDVICDAFEAAWQGDSAPSLQHYLDPSIVDQRELFAQLLALDIDYRSMGGNERSPQEYRAAFPDFADVVDRVYSLFSADSSATVSLLRSDTSTPSFDIGAAPHDASPLLDGAAAQLGRYIIIRRLKRGEFGQVVLARDTELKRKVAIKFARANLRGNVAAVALFQREARTIAELDHPNIAPIYDVGQAEDGSPYFVMKYFPGGELRAGHEPVPPGKLAIQFAQLADALAAAHAREIIHRDIKPSNIMVDDDDRLCLVDFGLARRGDDVESRDLAGTPAYMSPEQFRRQTDIDGRSDIFGLGCVLYECLTGVRPFHGESLQRFDAPVVPVRQRNRNVSVRLEKVCQKMLAFDRSQRQASASDVADELRAAVPKEWNRLQTLMIIGVLLVAAIGTLLIRWSASRRETHLVAQSALDNLLNCPAHEIPSALKRMERWTPTLQRQLHRVIAKSDIPKAGRVELAMLSADSDFPAQKIYDWIEQATAEESLILTDQLSAFPIDTERLWAITESARQNDQPVPLAVVATLGKLDPSHQQWPEFATVALASFLETDKDDLRAWTVAFQPLGRLLGKEASHLIDDDNRKIRSTTVNSTSPSEEHLSPFQRIGLFKIVTQDVNQEHGLLITTLGLCQTGEEFAIARQALEPLHESSKQALSTIASQRPHQRSRWDGFQHANAAICLMLHGIMPPDVLKRRDFDDVRSLIVCRAAIYGVPLEFFVDQLHLATDVSVRRALILASAQCPKEQQSALMKDWIDELTKLYVNDPDPGVHAAAESALRHFTTRREVDELMENMERQSYSDLVDSDQQWWVNSERLTMIILQGHDFHVGEATGKMDKNKHKYQEIRFRRRFAIASHELTTEQWDRFTRASDDVPHLFHEKLVLTADSPVHGLSWHEAAAYCNWLSLQDKIPPEQLCYERVKNEMGSLEMAPRPGYRKRLGYRLPDEFEWEFAAKCDGHGDYSFGHDHGRHLYPYYMIASLNCQRRSWPVGSRFPNDFGLFDTYGATAEWTDKTDGLHYNEGDPTLRCLRGGSLLAHPDYCATWMRGFFPMDDHYMAGGLRVVRTLSTESADVSARLTVDSE